MRIRLVLSVILVSLGVGLPSWAIVRFGKPWGFRDRLAVLLEAAGDVELTAAPRNNRAGRPMPSGVVPPVPGRGLFVDDRVRAGVASIARFRVSEGELTASDHASLVFTYDGVLLERGRVLAFVREPPLVVRVGVAPVRIELDRGYHILIADGDQAVYVYPREGTARVTSRGSPTVEASGSVLSVTGDGAKVLSSIAAPTCKAKCRVLGPEVEITGKTAIATQVFVDGRVSYPAPDGKIETRVRAAPTGTALLFVRDIAGEVCESRLTCDEP